MAGGALDGFWMGCGAYAAFGLLLCIIMPIYAGATTKDRSMVSANRW